MQGQVVILRFFFPNVQFLMSIQALWRNMHKKDLHDEPKYGRSQIYQNVDILVSKSMCPKYFKKAQNKVQQVFKRVDTILLICN